MADIRRYGETWLITPTPEMGKSDIANFYVRTSNFHWCKLQETQQNEDGSYTYVKKRKTIAVEEEDYRIWNANVVCKMIAAGYLIHDFIDWANMKAVVMMDGTESEVGRSQGGTGKGIFGTQFEHICTVYWINGKRENLKEDKHIFSGVDERTHIIWFEDLRVNFDFEHLFPSITKATWVEKKGVDGFKLEPKKILLDTNHALNGNDNSHHRRQYLISFSDYYNKYRTVRDDFGHQFYEEWDWDQWNLFYNWIATCVQTYLRFGLRHAIPQEGPQEA